jgi:hypothetical protein
VVLRASGVGGLGLGFGLEAAEFVEVVVGSVVWTRLFSLSLPLVCFALPLVAFA